MDEVAFQEEVVAVLKKSLEGADVSWPGIPLQLHAWIARFQNKEKGLIQF